MASPLALALEAENSAAKETEYSYFFKLTNEELTALIELSRGHKSFVFSESKLAFDKEAGMMGRVRHYYKDNADTYEITTKHRTGESKTKIETNDTLSKANYEMLMTMATAAYVRTRIELPVVSKEGKEFFRLDGSPLVWEIDLYLDGRSNEVMGIHPWAKVELEVDNAALPSVVEMIPFAYSAIIASDSTVPEERALVDSLYANDYNVRGNSLSGELSEVIKLL